ncbi:hypothetical protein ACWGKW_18240 [Streptomyces sp. NPDC054766]
MVRGSFGDNVLGNIARQGGIFAVGQNANVVQSVPGGGDDETLQGIVVELKVAIQAHRFAFGNPDALMELVQELEAQLSGPQPDKTRVHEVLGSLISEASLSYEALGTIARLANKIERLLE